MGLYQGIFLIGFMRVTHTDRQTDRHIDRSHPSDTMPSAISHTMTKSRMKVRIQRRLCPGKCSQVLWWMCTLELWLPQPTVQWLKVGTWFTAIYFSLTGSDVNYPWGMNCLSIYENVLKTIYTTCCLSRCNNNGADFTLDIQKNHILRIWGS